MNQSIYNSVSVGNGRQHYLDYLKALAITLVITYHSNAFMDNCFMSSIMSMCVTIFFCVNGYLMLKKHRDPIYLLKKNIKLFFLIVFWGIISCCVATWLLDNAHFNPIVMLLHLYRTDVYYGNHLWFLFTLIILNVINPILFYFLEHANKYEKIILITFIGLCSVNVINRFIWHANPLIGGWHGFALFYYIMGYLCLNTKDSRLSTSKCFALFLIFILLQSCVNFAMLKYPLLMKVGGGDLVFSQYSSLFVICSTLALIIWFKKIKFPSISIINYIGKNTLGIYLVQDIVVRYYRYGAFNEFMADYPIVCAILTLLTSTTIVYILSKLKFTRFLISM